MSRARAVHRDWKPVARPISRDWVLQCARELGCDQVGVAKASPISTKDRYLAWLASGYAAEMWYLQAHQAERYDPARLLPGARAVIVVGLNYGPRTRTREDRFRVAGYAWGEDYHRVLRRTLRRLRSRMRAEYGRVSARICVDTAPFPDKYWAVEAGLGWQGKHTNVVSQEFGSYLLLGSLIVDCEFDTYDQPHADLCGTCDACLTACPTQAFPQPYVLDAGRCLSYWTIEYKGTEFPKPPDNPSRWVFGCDECLDACPWNRFASPARHPSMQRQSSVKMVESGEAAALTDAEFARVFEGTALLRSSRQGLARNMAVLEQAASSVEHDPLSRA